MAEAIGIISAACRFPSQKRTLQELALEEGAALTTATAGRLGIEEVHVVVNETGSTLALAAAQEAIQRAGLQASDLDVIVDYTILPQEYLVPAWNMSSRLQHELNASKAFTLGFSGGGATNFHVALNFATALLQSDENVKTALLLGAEAAIPANRILDPDNPLTVLGDGASAIILQKGARHNIILDTELWSDGEFHDVCYIPGGALAHPNRPELYRMQIDKEKYDKAPKMEVLQRLAHNVLERAGLPLETVTYFLYPNISASDQAEFMQAFGLNNEQICLTNRAKHGHVQATDFVLNYLSMLSEVEALHDGDYILMCSHGMGFLSGVTLVQK